MILDKSLALAGLRYQFYGVVGWQRYPGAQDRATLAWGGLCLHSQETLWTLS